MVESYSFDMWMKILGGEQEESDNGNSARCGVSFFEIWNWLFEAEPSRIWNLCEIPAFPNQSDSACLQPDL